MKRILVIIVVGALAGIVCFSAPPVAITNYYPGATVSNSTIHIPVSALTNGEFSASIVTNDVRAFVSAIVKRCQVAIAEQVSTNRFATYTITEDIRYPTATNRIVFRGISEDQNITISPSYVTE